MLLQLIIIIPINYFHNNYPLFKTRGLHHHHLRFANPLHQISTYSSCFFSAIIPGIFSIFRDAHTHFWRSTATTLAYAPSHSHTHTPHFSHTRVHTHTAYFAANYLRLARAFTTSALDQGRPDGPPDEAWPAGGYQAWPAIMTSCSHSYLCYGLTPFSLHRKHRLDTERETDVLNDGVTGYGDTSQRFRVAYLPTMTDN